MKRLRSSGIIAAALAACSAIPAVAYYHFTYYLPAGTARAKFDLSALPNKTVYFFVSETGPSSYSANDGFSSVVGQLRQAVQVWNGVASSDLRVAFGGFEGASTHQNTPAADVLFEDLPPGLLGYGGPTIVGSAVTPATGSPWVPISRSAIHLNLNQTIAPGPSYKESFFMTVVHEMGHALGLQHTFTSATMSTATTRATSLMNPIDSDDIAGISVLYPNPAFAQTGSISGRISSGGSGVHLASVVAIRSGQPAVSALTNPDGTYEIDGVPPGQYYVYAHALPPDADIKGPWNSDGSVFAASGPTNALFYPGTTDPIQATPISVTAGAVKQGIDLSLTGIPSLPTYDVSVYGYYANNTIAVKPAYLNMLGGGAVVAASGIGLGSNGTAPGLSAAFIGNSAIIASNGVRPYQSSGYTYVALDVLYSLFGSTGPQHLVLNTPGFMHVLPSAVRLTQQNPPSVDSVKANADGTLAVTGASWAQGSAIYFNGIPATASVTVDPRTLAGAAAVTPPSGANGQTAVLTIYNPDGQNSSFVQAAPFTYSYGAAPVQAIASVSPATLPAGAEAMVDIVAAGFDFTSGPVAVGFGTSDVVVRRVFVVDGNHLQVNVSVAPGAVLGTSDVSVFSGFRMATATGVFRVISAVTGLPAPVPTLTNAAPGLNGAYAGAVVNLAGVNLVAANSTPVVTLNGEAAVVLGGTSGQITLQLPADLPIGPVVLNLNNGALSAYPVLVFIDGQPATITGVQGTNGTAISTSSPAAQGDLLTVSLSGFAAAGSTISTDRVQVGLIGPAGTETMHQAIAVSESSTGVFQVSFLLSQNEATGPSETLIVYLDGHSSYPVAIPVATQLGIFRTPNSFVRSH